jgi:putative autoinducer-2 (AI-2) aldolase
MNMEDAVRLNAAGIGIQVFIGGEHETRSIHNMTKLVDAGLRHGMPVMGVTAVGKNMVRDAKYFRLACRIIAELGAQYVKTYYVDDGFETVTASCPVPIVMAGGKKLPELEALTMAYNAVQQGAAGVDMGRNIFQSDAPQAMISAVHAVVHKNLKPAQGFEMFKALSAPKIKLRSGRLACWSGRGADCCDVLATRGKFRPKVGTRPNLRLPFEACVRDFAWWGTER